MVFHFNVPNSWEDSQGREVEETKAAGGRVSGGSFDASDGSEGAEFVLEDIVEG